MAAPFSLPRLHPALLLLAGLAAPASAGDVHVVSAQGGGDFTTIQAAVDAAATGDFVLVKPGTYPGFAIAAKGLSVVADGAPVKVDGSMGVQDTVEGQPVLLAGLSATGRKTGVQDEPALVLSQTGASVRVEDCQLFGADIADSGCAFNCPNGEARGGVAVSLTGVTDVVFVRCSIRGGSGEDGQLAVDNGGGAGVSALGARMSFHHCDVRGGDGGTYEFFSQLADGGDGGTAIRAEDAAGRPTYVHLAGTSVRGGDGGDGGLCIDPAGAGGHGLVLVGGSGLGCEGLELDSTLQAGDPGCGTVTSPAGQPLVTSGGATLTQLPGIARSARVESVERELQPLTLTFEGMPGDVVVVVRSLQPHFTPLPTRSGVLHLERGTFRFGILIGVIPDSGTLQLDVVAPDLQAGFEGDRMFLQVLFRDQLQQTWPGPPATPVFLDASL